MAPHCCTRASRAARLDFQASDLSSAPDIEPRDLVSTFDCTRPAVMAAHLSSHGTMPSRSHAGGPSDSLIANMSHNFSPVDSCDAGPTVQSTLHRRTAARCMRGHACELCLSCDAARCQMVALSQTMRSGLTCLRIGACENRWCDAAADGALHHALSRRCGKVPAQQSAEGCREPASEPARQPDRPPPRRVHDVRLRGAGRAPDLTRRGASIGRAANHASCTCPFQASISASSPSLTSGQAASTVRRPARPFAGACLRRRLPDLRLGAEAINPGHAGCPTWCAGGA